MEENMKTIRITACVLLAVVLLTAMVSCGGASIVGTWVAEEAGIEITMEFGADGKGKMGSMGVNIDTTYKVVDGDTVEVTMSMAGIEQTQEFTYKVEGNKLYLTADGETQEFTRK
jgi:uncharacterized lipoprotein YehR (DUF1307 family)